MSAKKTGVAPSCKSIQQSYREHWTYITEEERCHFFTFTFTSSISGLDRPKGSGGKNSAFGVKESQDHRYNHMFEKLLESLL